MKIKIIAVLTLLSFSISFAEAKQNIGIIPFQNKISDSRQDWISYGFEYLLQNKLSIISGFYVQSTNQFQTALGSTGFGSETIDERFIYRLGKNAKVDLVINGTYEISGSNMNLTVTYYSAFNGTVIQSKSYREPLSGLFRICQSIVDDIITLTEVPLSDSERRLSTLTITESIAAYENFIRGYIENNSAEPQNDLITNYFSKAIQEDPRFWEAYYNLGIVYFNTSQFQQALAQFDKVIQALPNFDKPYYGRGLIQLQNEKYQEAVSDFNKVIELNPNDYKAYYNLGKLYIEEKDFTQAIKNLKEAEKLNPNFAPLFFEMGNNYFVQGQYRSAIDSYRRAAELDAQNVKYRIRLGETYYRSQIYYNAYNEFQAAIKLKPNEPVAHFMVGVTVYKQAVLEELVEAFLDMLNDDSLQAEKTSVDQKFNKKQTKIIDPAKRDKVYQEMVDAFTKAAQARPGFMEATFNLALTYHEMGNNLEAENYYKKVLLIKPDLVRAYMKLADLYTETNRKEIAIDQYRKVFYLEPGIFVHQTTLGAEHRYINVYDIFKKELDDQLAVNPGNPKNNLVLAKIYEAQGYYGKAANLLRNVLSSSPTNTEAREILARVEKKVSK